MKPRTFEIDVNDLDKIMKLIRYEQHVAAKLKTYLEYQKLQLKIIEDIKTYCKFLYDHRTTNKEYWKSIDPELKKTIKKYSGGY